MSNVHFRHYMAGTFNLRIPIINELADIPLESGYSPKQAVEDDMNHTGLSPHWISAIHGFVLTSDQVCPQGSMIIGLMVGTYFSHGFSPYLRVFGAIRPSSGSPSTTRGTLCMGYVDSSTQYSSYRIHVGISFPTVATHRLHLPYGSYVPSMLIPTIPTYHGLSSHPTFTNHLFLPQVPTKNIIHLTLSPWHHTKQEWATSLLVKDINVSPNDGSFFKISKSHIILKSTWSFQDLFKRSKWISHQVLLESTQDPGFETSFQPGLVHL